MYQLVYTNQFRKDIKLLQKRGYDMNVMKEAVIELEKNGKLQEFNQPHILSGNLSGYWEAHLKNDWLLIWQQLENEKEIWFTRTGTHSDIFK
jgi:mRNA interferase YafQ